MELGNIWKPEYVLDIDEIDQQHKYFLTLVSKIAGLIDSAHSGKQIKISQFFNVLFQMRRYAFKHFYTEEKLFIKYAYPGLFDHLEEHNSYMMRAVEAARNLRPYADKFNEQADRPFLEEMHKISEFILEWWTTHITEEDSKYAAHVRAKMKGKAGN